MDERGDVTGKEKKLYPDVLQGDTHNVAMVSPLLCLGEGVGRGVLFPLSVLFVF